MGIIMILFVVEIFSTILQRIFCESTLMKRKTTKALEIIVWSGYFILFNLITYTITGMALINMLVFVVTFFVAIRILYENPIRTMIAVTVFLYLSGMCSELFVFYGKELLPWNFGKEEEILFIVLSKLVWFCLIKLVSLLIKLNKKIELSVQDWLEVFMVPIASIWILLAFFRQGEDQGQFFGFIVVVMVLAINIFTYYLYDKAKETMEKRKREEILMQQCDYYVRQSKESTEWWEELRQFRHDMKQRYLLERIYLEAGDYDGLKKYCSDNLEFLSRKNTISRTGNIYIDSLINYKADMAAKQNIEVVADLNIPKDVELNVEDLSICLGNLLDNAIEASRELDDDRIIQIKIDADNKNLFLDIKNKFHVKRIKSGKTYLTSKENKKQHGLGLMVIQQIADKYEGEFDIHEENNEFEVTVLLYNFLH